MEKRPIRILQIMGTMNRGGAETFVMNVYRAIDKSQVQFDFVVHSYQDGAFDNEIKTMGGILYHAPKYKLTNHIAYCKWWKDFFDTHPEYYVIHSHIRSTSSIIFRIAKEYKITTIAHSHSTSNGKGIDATVKNFLQRGITKNADELIACSNESGKWLFGSEPFFVLKNGINVEAFQPNREIRNEYRNTLAIDSKTLACGHVGRFHEAKNHSFLIDVFYELVRINPDSKLFLVGDGPLRKDIEKKIKEKGIDNKVSLLGVRGDVDRILQAFDCFIFPSVWEGFPVSLLEAEAVGLPCIVSDSITKEAILSPNVQQLSIHENPTVWANCILQSRGTVIDNTDSIRRAGFDMSLEIKWIEAFYLDLYKKHNAN